MADLDKHLDKLVIKLQSPNPDDRYDACEYLRAAPKITEGAIKALKNALNDHSPEVVEAAMKIASSVNLIKDVTSESLRSNP